MILRAAYSRLFLVSLVLPLIASLLTPGSAPPASASGTIAATPAAISEIAAPGQRVTRALTITNTGGDPLTAALYEARTQALPAITGAAGPTRVPLPSQDQPVDARLATELATPAARGPFIVYLRDQADLSAAYTLTDWAERGWFVYRALVEHANRTQRGLRAELAARGLPYRPFWIVNAIQVDGALADAQALAARSEVALVRLDATLAITQQAATPAAIDTRCSPDGNPVCWNIRAIGADRAWNDFGVTGSGVVVASVDTGVAFNHPALRDRYRGASGSGEYNHNYNWYDPQGAFLVPTDENGHGTHTLGTVLGALDGGERFGVAPGARWIAAQGCDGSYCSESDLIGAAQWLLAPTDLNDRNPRPDLRPMIANNSWAGAGNDPWYAGFTAAWRAAGIFPVFAAGNGTGACNSIASPGDYTDVVAVGAVDRNNAIASFSLRGPAADGRMKPDFTAPGVTDGTVGIYSSVPGGYNTLRGTSMATPHVAGLVALLWSANPALIGDYDATYAIMRDTARRIATSDCGGTLNGGANNVYGWGVIDAYAAVARARVDVPWLSLAAPSAMLAPGGSTTVDVTLDAGLVPGPGTYTARIQIYPGDLARAPTTVEVTLQVLPPGAVAVTGAVRDADTGTALAARVGVASGQTVATAADGSFTLTLAPGTYTLTASALGYIPQQQTVTVPAGGPITFALSPDVPRLALSADRVAATLDFATVVTETIQMTNQGTQPLTFEATVAYAPFGIYRSDEPGGPVYQWVDLPPDAPTLTLTNTSRIDDVPLGLNFPLFSYVYTETSVTSDGALSFGWPYQYTGLKERCLPASEAFYDLLAPFRADLDPSRGGTVRYGTINGGGTFVVSFERVPAADGPSEVTYTFQALLHADGRIVYQYADLGALPARLSVGAQKNLAQVQLIGCGADTPIAPGLAIELRPQARPEGWADVGPRRGIVAPGASAPLAITYRWQAPPQGARLRTLLTIISSDPRRRTTTVTLDATMRAAPHGFWLSIIARR
ncbi:MAG: S8 family serine peptidase [Chloroflexi bacterium]|nr:S8 family serine peptidase [Chloroflexota bacterium]